MSEKLPDENWFMDTPAIIMYDMTVSGKPTKKQKKKKCRLRRKKRNERRKSNE